jgi:hypothetical protein
MSNHVNRTFEIFSLVLGARSRLVYVINNDDNTIKHIDRLSNVGNCIWHIYVSLVPSTSIVCTGEIGVNSTREIWLFVELCIYVILCELLILDNYVNCLSASLWP